MTSIPLYRLISKESITVLLVSFLLYLWSMPRSVVLEDDALFVLASYYNGVAHPPGYPVYTLLGHLFTYLPFGTIAFRVHLLSALFATVSIGVIGAIIFQLTRSRFLSATAALMISISPMFWSQAIIAEVYTLNVALFFMLFFMAMNHIDHPKKLFLFAFLYGVALANHWPLIVLSTPALLILIWHERKQFVSLMPLFGIIMGLSPYIWMVVNSNNDPYINFYGALESFSEFWFFITREGYAGQDHSQTASLLDKLYFVYFFISQLIQQYGYAGFMLGALGFIIQWSLFKTNIAFAITTLFLCNSLLLILLLSFDYQLWDKNVFRVYPLLSYCAYAFWVIAGLTGVVKFLNSYIKKRYIQIFTLCILFVSVFPQSVLANYRANDTWAMDYAYAVLNNIEQGAVLFTHGDMDLGPLVYVHSVLGHRQDVTIYHNKGLILSNRYILPLTMPAREQNRRTKHFLDNTDRPIYYVYTLPHNYGVIDNGLVSKVDKSNAGHSKRVSMEEESVNYLEQILSNVEPEDAWEKMHKQIVLNKYCRFFINLYKTNDKGSYINNETSKVCYLFSGKLELID